MNKKTVTLILGLALICSYKPVSASNDRLPEDFIKLVSKIYKIPSEFGFSAGGAQTIKKDKPLNHYPVIMIPANKRSFRDWLGKNPGNANKDINVYSKLVLAGFMPEELWLYQYTDEDKEMKNIEESTDGLKWFIYSVLYYTKSSKVQILAHGEGAVLAQATIKKYNLYNLIHAVVYIAGPFHGSSEYTYIKALTGSPVCANLAIDSDFLQDIAVPEETPYNISENENNGNIGIKYMTIYNGLPYKDGFFNNNPASPSLIGAHNHELNSLGHDELRCAQESSGLFIPFLSDEPIKYNNLYDKDKDGFMSDKYSGIDCNDGSSLIFPGAPEIQGDNTDQNCDGMDTLPVAGKDCLAPIKKNSQ
jgi:hypothetical protein